MSHITTLKMDLKDLVTLTLTGAEFGMEMCKQDTYRHYQSSKKGECDWALVIPNKPNAYQIGIKKMPDGNHDLMFDLYDSTLSKQVKGNVLNLVMDYKARKIMQVCKKEGSQQQIRELLPNGSIKVRALYA